MNGTRIIHALIQTSRRFPLPSSLSARRLSCLPVITRSFDLHNSSSFSLSGLVDYSTKPTAYLLSSSLLTVRLLNTSSIEDKGENGDYPLQYEATEEIETIDEWEEENEAEPKVGDGGDGGGVVLQGVPWGERALSIAHEVLLQFGDEMKLYAFKTSPRGYIYVRLDKVSNEYGCPSMEELERYSQEYKKRLDEVGVLSEIPDDLALEVSSPGAERILKVPDDLRRFKDMPVRVCYVEDAESDSAEKDGVFMLESIDTEAESCVWKLADVRENRDPQSKGRPLSRKRKDWRLKLPFPMHRRITLYLEH